MLKTKPLRPAFREKKRYLVYKADSFADNGISMYAVQQSLVSTLTDMLGVFDGAAAGILPIKFDKKSNKGIIRVNHTAVDRVRACFALISELEGVPVRITSVGVSGILKKAKENYFQT
ncbi:MAG: Rpp14/Pop5 family protein [Candidatus Woesearchaeota archaeon]